MFCTYCHRNKATTSDHVPPKQLYRWHLFKDLMTVPSCEKCNNEMSHDEEYFRDIVIGLLCHTSQAEELFDGKISRAFDRNPRREARMFGVLETVEDQIALDIDFAKINRVAAKIAVGLEAAVGQRKYPMNTQFRVVFAEVGRSSDAGSRFSPDFSYTKLYPEGWEFTFFDSVQFVVLPN